VKLVWVCILAALALAGCGGGSKHAGGTGDGAVTVGAYGNYPAQTITGSASAAECTKDARAFAHDGITLLRHSGPDAAYPADLYYSILREDFADFTARSCDARYVGVGLRANLTAKQISALVADLPTVMAKVVRAGLAVTRP
jgi:hypothetical protein